MGVRDIFTYLRCGAIVKLFIAESDSEIFFKSMNIWRSYGQKVVCVVHFLTFFNLVKWGEWEAVHVGDSCHNDNRPISASLLLAIRSHTPI